MSQAAAVSSPVRSQKWSPEFDEGRSSRARLGFLLIPSEPTIEADMHTLAPPGVGIHFARMYMPEGCTVDNLAAMKGELTQTASLLLPGFKVDVVCYACTAGSMVIGEQAVVSEIERATPGRYVTTLVTSCVDALQTVGAKRIVIGTPYTDEVNAVVVKFFKEKGFEVLNLQGMGLVRDNDISRVTPKYIAQFAQEIDHPDADAIFMSCGALRAIDALDAIEEATGKPAISSNQAMMWHCLRKAGIKDQCRGYGRLLAES